MNKFPLHYQFNEKHNEFFNTFKVLKKEKKQKLLKQFDPILQMNDDFFFTSGTLVKFMILSYGTNDE